MGPLQNKSPLLVYILPDPPLRRTEARVNSQSLYLLFDGSKVKIGTEREREGGNNNSYSNGKMI